MPHLLFTMFLHRASNFLLNFDLLWACLVRQLCRNIIMADLNPNAVVEVLFPENTSLAEGPYYEQETNSLLWVDAYKYTVNFLDVSTGENRFLKFSDTVTAVIPVEGSSKEILVTIGRKICVVNRVSGEIISVLDEVEKDRPKNLLNDAKCDSSGRLWCGTMSPISAPAPNHAALYSHSAGVTRKHLTVTLSNGLEWNQADDTMYYIDTGPKKLYCFSYNKEDGSLSDQRVLIDYSEDAELGNPDGMCKDTQGRLWVAGYLSQRVTCWDPQTGKKVLSLKIPGARTITSCCFGGPNFEWLFVTSGSILIPDDELSNYPNTGAIFVVKNLGARGLPANKFRLLR